jgi:hypothetical protein
VTPDAMHWGSSVDSVQASVGRVEVRMTVTGRQATTSSWAPTASTPLVCRTCLHRALRCCRQLAGAS